MKRLTILFAILFALASCSKTKKYPIPLFEGVPGTEEGSAKVQKTTSPAAEAALNLTSTNGLLSISVEPANLSIPIGIPQEYRAIGIYEGGIKKDITSVVTWSSGDTAIATIIADSGEVTGVATGSILVTATLDSVSGTGNLTVTNAKIASIKVVRADGNDSGKLASGSSASVQYIAIGVMDDGTEIDLTKLADWSSSETDKATVDNADDKGLVSGTAAGTPTITASYGGESGETLVTVTEATLESIIIDSDTTLTVDGIKVYKAIGTFSDGTTQDITHLVNWASSDANTAVIDNGATSDNRGSAVAKAAGSAIISATYLGKTASSTLTVVAPASVSSLAISPSGTSTIAIQTNKAYTAIVTYSDGTTKDVTSAAAWTSSDNTIAGISNQKGTEGNASGVTAGSVTIKASFAGKEATATLEVANKILQSISVANVSVSAGSGMKMVAIGIFSDGSSQDITDVVTWSQTDDTNVAEMTTAGDNKGTVYGKSAGTANVTASMIASDGSTITSPAAEVAVKALSAIEVSNVSVAVAGTAQLTATAVYTDGSRADITDFVIWTPNTGSGDTTYFMVGNVGDEKGVVTGRSTGVAFATATLGTISGSGAITVTGETTASTTTKTVGDFDATVPEGLTAIASPDSDFDGIFIHGDPAEISGFIGNYNDSDDSNCVAFATKIVNAITADANTTSVESVSDPVIGDAAGTCTETRTLNVTTADAMKITGLSNILVEVIGSAIGGSTIDVTNISPQTVEEPTNEFKVKLQASYSTSGNELVGVGISRKANYADNQAILESLLDGTGTTTSGSTKTATTKTFTATADPKVDFVWVVDNSGSMAEEQATVVANASTFFSVANNNHLDFRLGVLSTGSTGSNHDTLNPGGHKAWELWGTGWVEKGETNAQENFSANVEAPGTDGYWVESAVFFAERALGGGKNPISSATIVPRDGAKLIFIYLTDEGDFYKSYDSSWNNKNSQAAYVEDNIFVDNNYVVNAIMGYTGSAPGSCSVTLDDGTELKGQSNSDDTNRTVHYELVQKTKGMVATICAADYGDTFTQIVQKAAGSASAYTLDHTPISSSIVVKVTKDGVTTAVAKDSENGWSYNATSNTIIFSGTAWPEAGATIDVSYEYYDSVAFGITDSNRLMAYISTGKGQASIFTVISLMAMTILIGLFIRKRVRLS